MFNLLIVDDERHLVDSMADTIEWQKFGIEQVFKAYSAAEALETINMNPVNIVVTDIRMPGMDGIELIGRLSAQWAHIQIIILSGHADFQYAQTAVKHNVVEYLLKPVNDADITEAVAKVSVKLSVQRDSYLSEQKQQQLLNQNLPLMSSNLLYDLLNGKRVHTSLLDDLKGTYGIPFGKGDEVSMLLIRKEGKFVQFDYNDQLLMDFSVLNMLQELFSDCFYVWHSREVHDYLAVIIKPKANPSDYSIVKEEEVCIQASRKAEQLQRAVQFYLQGSISIMISQLFAFPAGLQEEYRRCVSRFRNHIGEDEGILISWAESGSETKEIRSLQRLYEPLTIAQLMDLGKWQEANEKLEAIVQELQTKWSDSHEHLLEVFHLLTHSFLQFLHSNGLHWSQLNQESSEPIDAAAPIRSARQLQQWAEHILERLERLTEAYSQDGRSQLVKQVNQYIETHLSNDVSLQIIADHVRFNPAYLSKIYKQETGEGISEFTHRLRMDKALHLLKQPLFKIYEITELLGYQNPQYFSKLFKREYGCTPQEFRDKHYSREVH
ncbi:response regulator [Paenibacillus sp. FSL H8-0034]|uniref:response regulator n=1 Tax=Paenibacillus sp. FSL H8-0034 TaxID=2954671 RepID=UPI0030F9CB38